MKIRRHSQLSLLLVLSSCLQGASAFVPLSRTTPSSTLTSSSFIKENQQQHPASRQDRSYSVSPLHALPFVDFVTNALPSLALLTAIITIHESGHYLAARLFGMKVDEFSIGVGPKAFGFTAFGNEFNLRLLPLGGFVRFPENYNATEVRVLENIAIQNAKAFDERQDEMDVATKVLNAVTLGSIDDKRRKQAKERRLEQQELAAAKQRQSWWSRFKKRNDVEEDAIPELLDLEDVQIDFYDDPDLLQNRPWFQRAVVISGGVIFNLLLAWSIYFGQISLGPGLPSPIFDAGAVVGAMPRPDTASSGLLQRGDVILAIDGRPITESRPSALNAEKGINSFISSIRSTPEGEAIKLTVLHPGAKAPVNVDIKPTKASAKAPATIGVMLSPNFVKSEIVKTNDVVKAGRLAADYTIQLTKVTAGGIASAFGGLLKGKGETPQVTGPIGLIRTGSEIVATKDLSSVLMFAAAISVNLGVVNALPFPALDGGQLLFILAEAVTRKKVDQRVQEGLTGFALLFLLLFSASAAIGDIESIFGM